MQHTSSDHGVIRLEFINKKPSPNAFYPHIDAGLHLNYLLQADLSRCSYVQFLLGI
jgi:hypothetical protein